MSKSKKRIEILTSEVKSTEDNVTLKDILLKARGYKFANEFKDYELKILSTANSNIIIGLITTGHNKNLPPKKDKLTGNHSKLGIDISKENLSYGNVFLYDKEMNVLFYEINKNGCDVDDLVKYLKSCWNKSDETNLVEVSFYPVSRKGEYQRLLKMSYFKEFQVEIANPSAIMQDIEDDDSTMLSTARKYISDAAKSNTDTMVVKFAAHGKKHNKFGLGRQNILKLAKSFQHLFTKGHRQNINVLKVKGYYSDPELPSTLQPINLITDTFNVHISLTDKIQHEDLQGIERAAEIEKLYNKLLPELKTIFSSNNN